MLRLAFDFIIAWREIRARPNAYARICRLYGLHAWAVRHTLVNYRNTAAPHR